MLPRKRNRALTANARALRRNMTNEERRLWYDYLRRCPGRFSRQKVLGRYIADFYSAQARLVIELDGSQHYEPENQQKDAERTAYLRDFGLRVIRIPNNEVNRNFTGVCEYIEQIVAQRLEIINSEDGEI